ncbi:MAG: NAD(P)H-dependent oxidoreductase [Gammaproteobacteria bacterium]|nr:NAD(P)H-dependent oxidoreductase [Gammaproteobacteria bacterium]MDP2141460.1 NAD(P)H-dependent oxidoreductase [Gammaproteobacteria bacterium]MDP2347515.1 NAD(P)H-dependent oxidoreductase [Gammaproteobacteria bacterium]
MIQTAQTNHTTKVLQLKTSLFDGAGNEGVSTQLSGELLSSLHKAHGNLHVTTRDFSTEPVPYLDGAWLKALSTPAVDRTQEQQDKVAYSDALIAELQAADVVIIGVPMYNFAVPGMLKSWTDHVARAGVTFKYTDKGAVGLVTGKKVYLVLAMGGRHDEGITDHMRPYLRTILGFLGLTEIEIVVADGLNMGETYRAQGLQQAREQIQNLLATAGGTNSTQTEIRGEAA